MPFYRTIAAFLLAVPLAMPIFAQDASKGGDALRAVLLESKDKNRGVAIHTNGVTINAVVTDVDDKYVIGKSQQSSRIVIRLDRIDAVSAFF
jgi:hypothetical protein